MACYSFFSHIFLIHHFYERLLYGPSENIHSQQMTSFCVYFRPNEHLRTQSMRVECSYLFIEYSMYSTGENWSDQIVRSHAKTGEKKSMSNGNESKEMSNRKSMAF